MSGIHAATPLKDPRPRTRRNAFSLVRLRRFRCFSVYRKFRGIENGGIVPTMNEIRYLSDRENVIPFVPWSHQRGKAKVPKFSTDFFLPTSHRTFGFFPREKINFYSPRARQTFCQTRLIAACRVYKLG